MRPYSGWPKKRTAMPELLAGFYHSRHFHLKWCQGLSMAMQMSCPTDTRCGLLQHWRVRWLQGGGCGAGSGNPAPRRLHAMPTPAITLHREPLQGQRQQTLGTIQHPGPHSSLDSSTRPAAIRQPIIPGLAEAGSHNWLPQVNKPQVNKSRGCCTAPDQNNTRCSYPSQKARRTHPAAGKRTPAQRQPVTRTFSSFGFLWFLFPT